jgi:hypothetical protein
MLPMVPQFILQFIVMDFIFPAVSSLKNWFLAQQLIIGDIAFPHKMHCIGIFG